MAASRYRGLQTHLTGIMNASKAAGTYKTEKVLTGPMDNASTINGKSVITLSSNNYLGLGNHPQINKAAQDAIHKYGFGSGSARSIIGTNDIHLKLEAKVSSFMHTESTIVYNSCLDANTGFFDSLFHKEDAIISDSLNHASIIDGIRLSKAARYRYTHNDMNDLEEKLKQAEGARFKIVATDGVFSMDGDLAPIDKLLNLTDKYGALQFVDDCHGVGTIGKTGRGVMELYDALGQADIVTGTFGKAIGANTGGFTTGRSEIIDYLRQTSRTYMFSNNMQPCTTAGALESIELLEANPGLVENLAANNRYFREKMAANGWACGGHPDVPIVPIMIYDGKTALEVADELFDEGLIAKALAFPIVGQGLARIRVQIMSTHTRDQLDFAVEAFRKVGKQRKLI